MSSSTPRYVLAIDEGSTGVRALIFDQASRLVGGAYREIASIFPQPGWVEQDAEGIWTSTLAVIRGALEQARLQPSELAAIGITNQRSTTLVWDAASGVAVYPAISWQDNRTLERIPELMGQGVFANPMASLTKVEWILRHIPDGQERADRGELRFGTIDSWLAWKLSGGALHVTDPSNASCTLLYNAILSGWDDNAMAATRIPSAMLPAVRESSEVYGTTSAAVFGASVPIAGMAGDQQAALFGELGIEMGAVKATFGTSTMIDVNTGPMPVMSPHGAYPVLAWSVGGDRPFCLEGTVITVGAAVQWLRDGLGILATPEESGPLAASVPDSGGVWVIPSFQGLGTPYNEMSARAVIGGLSRGTTRAHIVRALLEGVAFRVRRLFDTLCEDAAIARPTVLRADGGAAANDFLLQSVADAIGIPVQRPETVQASALGAAYLAGLATGVWSDIEEVRGAWRSGRIFEPVLTADERNARFADWERKIPSATL